MTIEFRCTGCQSLLRTKDETAGKNARCPSCGTILQIPAVGTAAANLADTLPGVQPGAATPTPDAAHPFTVPRPPGAPFGAPSAPQGMALPPIPPASDNPYQSPLAYDATVPPGAWDASGAAVPTPISPRQVGITEVFSRSWAIFQQNWGACTLAAVIMVACQLACQALIQLAATLFLSQNPPAAAVVAMTVAVQVVNQIVSAFFYLGIAAYTLALARGKRPTYSLVFSGGRYLVRGALLGILFLGVGVILFLGGAAMAGVTMALCREMPVVGMALIGIVSTVLGVVAIYVMLGIAPTYYVLVDRDASLSDAVAWSWTIMRGNRLTFFLVGVASMPIIVLGMMAFCVGIVFSMAFILLTYTVAYLLMSGQRTGDMQATS